MRVMSSFSKALLAIAVIAAASGSVDAQMRGHGGPVRALAIAPDGKSAISGSFDTSAIRWSLTRNAAEQVMRFHESAVNAVAFLPDGRIVTGGEDSQLAIWTAGKVQPDLVLKGHKAPVAGLAISPDGKTIASASWDHTIRLWPVAGGEPRVLEGHSQSVNGVAFAPDGSFLASAGYDATLRIWPLSGDAPATIRNAPAPLNSVVVAPDGEIAAGGANGHVFIYSPKGELISDIEAAPVPVIAAAMSRDGARIAAAGIRGSVAVIDRKARKVVHTLVGPGLPVWSVAFFPDGTTLLTGGTDRMIRRWNAATGDHLDSVVAGAPADPLAAYNGQRGAEVFRACVACHTLSPDDGSRAGPTLSGIFGRKIASLPGYNFSPALKKLDIVWTPETVARLFEIGPMAYTPGTKMPEQKITSPDDRKALVEFLAKATARN
ncbi:MAG: c-type cytochrome [Rhizobiaceae bacterium]